MKNFMKKIILIQLLLSGCGEGEIKKYELNIMESGLFDDSALRLVNSSSVSDLECLKMNFSVSGISDGKEAFIPFFSDGVLTLDNLIVKLSQGEEVTLTDMVNAWSSPASISIDSSIKDLKLLINGFYSLCYKGKPVNIMFSGENDFSESDLDGDALDVSMTASTLMPVNASDTYVSRAAEFDKTVDDFTYVIIAHQKDKFNTVPFACSDLKKAGSTPNKIQVKPYFFTLNEDGTYATTEESMFDDSYSGYYRHDFNFIEKGTDNFADLFPSMLLFPVFTAVDYEILYTQGTGDQCTLGDTLSSKLKISKKDKADCPYSEGKILLCSVDWDDTTALQKHSCRCVTRP